MKRALIQAARVVLCLAVVGVVSCGEDDDRAACETLIACATAVGAMQAGSYTTTYGDNGACWDASDAATCNQQCTQQMAAVLPDGPDDLSPDAITACKASSCSSDADCQAFGRSKLCNPASNVCMECVTDDDCGGVKCVVVEEGGVPCSDNVGFCFCETT